MISDKVLRLLEEATCLSDAKASLEGIDESTALIITARGKHCSIRLDRSFKDDPKLAIAICRGVVSSLHRSISEGVIGEIKESLHEG